MKVIRDEILTIALAAWRETGNTVMYFDDISKENLNPQSPWCLAQVIHTAGQQVAFGSNRYSRSGIVVLQISTPTGGGYQSDEWCEILMRAFNGVKTPSGAWFSNTRAQELGRQGVWNMVNITTNFYYEVIT